MTQPKILILDEPTTNLNPKKTKKLNKLITELHNHHNTTILLIKHDIKLMIKISNQIYIINQKTPLTNDTPKQIHNNPNIIHTYLNKT